jgi:hypothetical protein
MNEGESNQGGQELIRKTNDKSTTHPFARIWVMRCGLCRREYGSNSCDAHIRRCPYCDPTAARGEPV